MAQIDLAAEGLQPGDNIDPHIEEHFVSGNDVSIPPGEYQSNWEWMGRDVSDASLVGHPDGVVLDRSGDAPTWDSGDTLRPTLNFGGHVIIENITFRGFLGQPKEKFDVTGDSDSAHLEFRNVNWPDGGYGCGDSYYSRARGDGRVTYRWCYFGPTANSGFYQTASASESGSIRQVFDGCVFINPSDGALRGGTQGWTIINTLFYGNGEEIPSWSDSGGGDPLSSGCHDASFNAFKMDQDFQFDGHIENIHLWIESGTPMEHLFDWQPDQPGTSGTMDGVFIHLEEDADGGNWSTFGDWTVSAWNETGSGSVQGRPPQVGSVGSTGANATHQIWTPGGAGLGFLTRPDTGTSPVPPGDVPGGNGGDGGTGGVTRPSELSVLEIVSLTQADFDYAFTIDGYVEQHPDDIEDNDAAVVAQADPPIMEATGRTGSTLSDTWNINGMITDWQITSGMVQPGVDFEFRVDGTRMTDIVGLTAPDGGDGGPTPGELQVVGITAQTPSAEAGDGVVFDVMIENVGGQATDGEFGVVLNGTLVDAMPVPTVQPGETVTDQTTSLTVTQSTMLEIGGFSKTFTFDPAAPPELEVASIATVGGDQNVGDNVQFEVVVENNSGEATSDSYPFLINGSQQAVIDTGQISPGNQMTFTVGPFTAVQVMEIEVGGVINTFTFPPAGGGPQTPEPGGVGALGVVGLAAAAWYTLRGGG